MTSAQRYRLRGFAVRVMTCVLIAPPTATFGGSVTLSVNNQSGTAAEDAVVIFDPLDAVPPASHVTVAIDQINKTFVPKVTVIRTGTAVMFPNSDRIHHQVYSFSTAKTFSLKLYAGIPSGEVVFDKPGLAVLGCNIHDSMVAFVAVVDSPYFAKIPHSGTIDLTLPAGRYRMRAWHPNLHAEFTPVGITVGSGALTIPLALDVDAARDEVAPWTD